MSGEASRIMEMVKKTVDKDTCKKLSKIKEQSELVQTAKHILINYLENEEYKLGRKLQYLKNYGNDVFFAENKYLLLDSKIKHFKAGFLKEDYIKVMNLIKSIKEEILHVQSAKLI